MRRTRLRSSQRGAALLTAMIVVVMVSTLASSMVWQQWRAIQVEEAERSRSQSALILTGALDWARLILREDAGTGNGTDDLNEPWAVPLAEARLSTFLAADRNNTDSGPEAFLSGQISDAQSRYNLWNLTEGELAPERKILAKLFGLIGVSQDIANRLADALQSAKPAAGSTASSMTNKPLMPESIKELRWLGLDTETIKRIEPYVVILPGRTSVNLNTAPREVIAAVIDNLDLAGAERLVQARQQTPFKTVAAAQALLPNPATIDSARADIKSGYFEVRGRLRLADRALEERSLVQRTGRTVNPIQRERISSEESATVQ
jgi:general secretion pathway protein K